MEMYNVPEQGHAGAYMIQGAEPAQITSPLLQNFETMFNEGVPEFVVDQGLYYPTTTNYGYLCTGFESPSDWDDHQRIFGLDGQDIQYMGAPNENLPYLYYTPNYEYAESAYNPYNPYIPGAVVGVDGSYLGAQQYYTISAYENNVSSPSYFPVVLPNTSDVMVNRADTVIESNISAANRADGSRLKHNLSSASPIFTPSLLRPASGHNNFNRGSESAKYNARSGKQPVMHGNIASDRFSIRPSEVHTGKVSQATRSVGHGKALSNHVQLRASVPSSNDSSHLGSGAHERVSAGKGGLLYGRVPNDVNVSPDSLNEQNRGPRTNRSKNQLVVKAYTSRAGNVDAQGNIVIHADEYNRDNFQLDLLNAKFFVIKSYSEDDVHKSIKYNVWSSTPNGNKKLNSAFEDAQRVPAGDPRGCPVFLFFSVNASGQFCGVAEMTGPVNFYKDMDFWQQDKWSGSFPVKWHIIKDVPNPNFRHIILENNENKPVTNSRDTQEIHYKKGIEMLKVFKNYASGTSLLDDFLYYETRQKFLQEEKAKLLVRSYENPFFVPVLDPPRKLNSIFDFPSSEGETISKHNDSEHTENCVVPAELDFIDSKTNKKNASDGDKFMVDEDRNTESALRIASLTINPKDVKSQTPEAECTTAVTLASAESVDVVTVGSMPIKVNGFAESSGFISIGTIPLDPRALQRD